LLGGLMHPSGTLPHHDQVVNIQSHAHNPEDIQLFADVIALDQARHMNRVITIDSDFREFSLCGANPLEGGFGVGVE
jgi:hypothetical protein